MRWIFKLLDIIFVLLGLPYLYYLVLHLIQQGLGAKQEALLTLIYLLIAFANYRDKWNEKEKKGPFTYPLLIGAILYHYFDLKVALIGGFVTLLLLFFRRFSTIFVSGGLLTMWVITFLEPWTVRSVWNPTHVLDFFAGWKIIFPLLGGWIYLKIVGRFYPRYLKNVAKKKKSIKWLRFKIPKFLFKRKKRTSSFQKKTQPETMTVNKQAEPISPVEPSVPIRQVIALIQEMTKDKGIQWTSGAKDVVSQELQHYNGSWDEDRLYHWARRFIKALDQDTLLIDSQTVYRTLDKLRQAV